MKKLLIFLMLGIFLISFVSAFEFDNIKTYDNATREVTIINAYGLGDTIGKAKLNTPLNVEVSVGYQKVAEFEISTFQDYSEAMKQFSFTDMKTKEKINRDYDLKYRTYEDILIDDYDNVIISYSENGTAIYDYQKVGEHYENQEKWIKITPADLKKNDVLTIGVFTEVQHGDFVDWVPVIMGIQILEWATWSANVTITDGLAVSNYPRMSTFNISNTEWYTISGQNDGLFYGYVWNGAGWTANSTIVGGLVDVGNTADVETFFINGKMNLISGSAAGFFGYTWNGTGWSANSTINASLTCVGGACSPAVFNFNGTWYLISGKQDGTFDGWVWNGGGWTTNSGIVVGLVDIGSSSRLDVFYTYNSSAWYLIANSELGEVDGYTWNGTGWSANSTIENGLTNGLYDYGKPNAYQKGDYLNIIIGYEDSPYALGYFMISNTSTILDVDLNSPSNNSFFGVNNILFNATAGYSGIFPANYSNMSLWTNKNGSWIISNTTILSGVPTSTQTWNLSFDEGSYIWNAQACESNGNCAFQGINWTLTIDQQAPKFNLISPNQTFNLLSNTSTLYLSGYVNDTSLDDCWYFYKGTNTTFSCTTETLFNISVTQGNSTQLSIIVYANDTLGNVNSSEISWNYNLFQTGFSYSVNTIEGATEIFLINISKISSIQISTINLIYNNTAYSTSYSISNNLITGTNNLNILKINEVSNLTFYWSIQLADDTIINTTSYNQTVNILSVDNCSVFTNLIYNYTIYDEETQTKLINLTTIEIQINIYNIQGTILVINFSQAYNNTNYAAVCMNSSLLMSTNYSLDSVVKYHANLTDGTNYATEYYNILNFTLSNQTIPKNISLYDLDLEDSTEFQLTFRDQYLALASDVLVHVYRQYVADNDFKVVEIPLTDSNGQTILHLVRNDIVYNFIMTDKNGKILANFNKLIAFCQDYTIGSCTINLNARSVEDEMYTYDDNVELSYSISFSNLTDLISLNFVTTDLEAKTIRMDVIRYSDFGNRTVCSDSLLSASGTITCNTSSITDSDRFLFIDIFSDGNFVGTQTIDLEGDGLNFGTQGLFLAFLLMLLIICLFMDDKQVLIVAIVIGWGIIVALGLIEGSIIGLTSAGIWLIVTAIIFIWKLKKEEIGA